VNFSLIFDAFGEDVLPSVKLQSFDVFESLGNLSWTFIRGFTNVFPCCVSPFCGIIFNEHFGQNKANRNDASISNLVPERIATVKQDHGCLYDFSSHPEHAPVSSCVIIPNACEFTWRNSFVGSKWYSQRLVEDHALLRKAELVQEVAKDVVELLIDELLRPLNRHD
jgi:hypothetical protein